MLKAQPITCCKVLRKGLGTETLPVFAVILVMLNLDQPCLELGGSPQGGDGSRVLFPLRGPLGVLFLGQGRTEIGIKDRCSATFKYLACVGVRAHATHAEVNEVRGQLAKFSCGHVELSC